ncbi:hypothetical protein BIS44_3816, partial [Mycobacterium tuberculosis variant bovis BCG]
ACCSRAPGRNRPLVTPGLTSPRRLLERLRAAVDLGFRAASPIAYEIRSPPRHHDRS